MYAYTYFFRHFILLRASTQIHALKKIKVVRMRLNEY